MDSRKIEMIKLALPRETISGLERWRADLSLAISQASAYPADLFEELELVSRELAARNFAIGDVF